MNTDDLTLGQLKEISKMVGCGSNKSCSIEKGEKYFIRTVTNYFTGKVKSITDFDIVLSDAAWIPDTGRFTEAVEKGTFNEVEIYPNDVIILKNSIIDLTKIDYELPRSQK